MGHDFIHYRDRHVHMRDMDIWTLRHFLCRAAATVSASELETDETTLQQLRNHFESWERIGTGVWLGTDLSEFVQDDPQRLRALRQVLHHAITLIEGFAGEIPLEYLQEHINVPMWYYIASVRTERFIEGLKSILEMIS